MQKYKTRVYRNGRLIGRVVFNMPSKNRVENTFAEYKHYARYKRINAATPRTYSSSFSDFCFRLRREHFSKRFGTHYERRRIVL